jgi:cation:H+ antiporter
MNLTMLLATVMLMGGLAAVLLGADWLVRGVSHLARAAGVPALVVGLTVVAFGTSTPEVVINTISAYHHETELAFGNLMGSCAINIGFVLAMTSLIKPLNVEKSIVTRELPLLVLAALTVVVLAADVPLNHADVNVLTRGDGLVLLLLFGVFLYSIVMTAIAARKKDPLIAEAAEEAAEAPPPNRIGANIVLSLVGLVGVAGGGRLAVLGAVKIAEAFGISEVVIGLTIVSFGTTLPELATGITAARRGHSDLALGNVVGSNIYNLLFIGGTVAVIHPVPVPKGGALDIGMMVLLSLLLLPFAIRQRRVLRSEGAVLLALYLGYLGVRLWFS